MRDKYSNFGDLKQHYQDESDYRIRFEDRGGRLLVLAPHGGGIERGTTELVRGIAGTVFSFYTFEGLLSSNNKDLHIASIHFDEPQAMILVSRVELALAIHGCCGHDPIIYIGGTDRCLKERLFRALHSSDYQVSLPVKGKYAGKEISNICNRTASGCGVQLEFSTGMRRLLFQSLSRSGRNSKRPLFDKLVMTIQEVLS